MRQDGLQNICSLQDTHIVKYNANILFASNNFLYKIYKYDLRYYDDLRLFAKNDLRYFGSKTHIFEIPWKVEYNHLSWSISDINEVVLVFINYDQVDVSLTVLQYAIVSGLSRTNKVRASGRCLESIAILSTDIMFFQLAQRRWLMSWSITGCVKQLKWQTTTRKCVHRENCCINKYMDL